VTYETWSQPESAIVDTGAPISLIIIGFEKLLSEFDVFFSYHTQHAFVKAVK